MDARSDGTNGTTRSANTGTNERVLHRFDLSGMTGQGVTVTGNGTITLTTATVNGLAADYKLYQIAAGNAGWQESTLNIVHNPSTAAVPANNGDPTWFYKSIDTNSPNTPQTLAAADTTSVKWLSGQTSTGGNGSNPEGYANTGGLWNWIDLVDQEPSTVASSYTTMNNMDPVATASLAASTPQFTQIAFTIPAAMIQAWIDDPSTNAGLLGRQTSSSSWDFASSQNGTISRRPTLSFDYVVPEPGTLGVAAIGGAVMLLRRRK